MTGIRTIISLTVTRGVDQKGNDLYLLIFKKSIRMKKTLWMLPGGHKSANKVETYRNTAHRENLEEVKLRISGYILINEHVETGRIYKIFEGKCPGCILDEDREKNLNNNAEGIIKMKWFSWEEIKGLEKEGFISKLAINGIKKSKGHGKKHTFIQRLSNVFQINLSAYDELKTLPNHKDQAIKVENEILKLMKQLREDPKLNKDKQKLTKKYKGTILVVDDNRSILEMLRDFFEKQGFMVITFNNPLLVEEEMQETLKDVKVALIDYDMPGMKGSTLAKKVRSINSEIKVVVLSGCKQEQVKGLEKGMILLQKPISLKNLLTVIETP